MINLDYVEPIYTYGLQGFCTDFAKYVKIALYQGRYINPCGMQINGLIDIEFC